jgi:hypothetical protein
MILISHCVAVSGKFEDTVNFLHLYTNIAWLGGKGGGTRWRSWLRHCFTSQEVAGSIPDYVIEIFHWHNPSGRTTLGLTQPLIEE